jgi:hypothetical protein
MGGASRTYGKDEKCMSHFGWKTWREEATGKTDAELITTLQLNGNK